jgi:multiple sugar transport system substrate-binding protein
MKDAQLSTRRVSRRAFLQGLGFGSMALVAAACAAPASAPTASSGGEAAAGAAAAAPAAEPVTIDFFAWADASDIPAWEALAKAYMEAHPNVTVKPSPSGTGNDYYTSLQTSFAGGTLPHITSFQGWEWQPYADAGLLAPIDDYIARDSFTAPYPDGVQSIEDSTRRDGKRYLIPLQSATMVMFYARKPLDEAGLAYPTDDWTFDDFLSMAQQLTNLEGETKMYGYQANGNWVRDIHWIRATGVQEFDQLVDPKTANFDLAEIVEIVQMVVQDFQYSMQISPTPADLESGANTINTGNAAMKYEGAWFFPQLNSPELRADNKQVEFDVVLMPKMADESRPHRGWAEGVTVPKTDLQDAAWDFAHFMGDTDGQKIYSTITGRMPNAAEVTESFWLPTIEERFGVTNGKAFIEAFKRSEVDVIGGVGRTQMWNEVVKPMGWDLLLNNDKTAAEVLPDVTKGVQDLLDAYWARKG